MTARTSIAALAGVASIVLLSCSVSQVGGAELRPIAFSEVEGWAADNHAAALAPFRRSCSAGLSNPKAPPLLLAPDALRHACAEATKLPEQTDDQRARSFFEAWFQPYIVDAPGEALLTGYYEPEFAGSLTKTETFTTPLLAFPNLRPPGPFPDRAAIEAGAFAGLGLELVWLDPVDAFFVHIQGSARINLAPDRWVRVRFAGRNGHPFTPIGRVLVKRGAMTLDEVDMASIRAWLAANPAQAPALMRENKSYIFFKLDEGRPQTEGPIGAQRVPITAGRTMAVDNGLWPYGLPIWIHARLPAEAGDVETRRLMIAQDTGAAIKGAARADIFVGTGHAAGRVAGRMKHRGSLIVLLPRSVVR